MGSLPLDVRASGPGDPFPGTVWVGDYGAGTLVVFEPNDFDGGSGPVCSGDYDDTLDEDGDGFSNADEVDNGTDPCSAGSQPPDWDGDFISDLNDPDDDNDGIPDELDTFALDPLNGIGTELPVLHHGKMTRTPSGGLMDLGFTGLMTNGVSNYAWLYESVEHDRRRSSRRPHHRRSVRWHRRWNRQQPGVRFPVRLHCAR
ncbi:MAG: thrombospondin type 3 repeat-containing protein [Dehalococcoidia bacterium]|nr:thrombospondin type 3 repeat-containing protein [Dehalococcoidia bacterium]